MEVQIKKTVRAGNSSAVVLPRAWLNKEVRVELVRKNHEDILKEALEITSGYLESKEIVGIYLVGSYARKEESVDSDIDILVISDNKDMEMIRKGIYNILIVSSGLLRQKLENDLLPIGPMIVEARSLINEEYLKNFKVMVTKKNVKWYLDTTKEKLRLVRAALDKIKGGKVSDVIAYTLILRIRTLLLIEKLSRGESYSKKEFIRLISKIAGSGEYERYVSVKNDLKDEKMANKESCKKLYAYLEKQLEKVRKRIN